MFNNSCFSYPYYVEIIFRVTQEKMLKIISFISREYAFLWNKGRNLFSLGVTILWILSMWYYLDEEIFSESLLFSGVTLLNGFTKSSKSGVVFNNNELFRALFSSFHCIILLSVLVQQARELLLHDKELKGKILLQHSMQYQDLSQFWGYL